MASVRTELGSVAFHFGRDIDHSIVQDIDDIDPEAYNSWQDNRFLSLPDDPERDSHNDEVYEDCWEITGAQLMNEFVYKASNLHAQLSKTFRFHGWFFKIFINKNIDNTLYIGFSMVSNIPHRTAQISTFGKIDGFGIAEFEENMTFRKYGESFSKYWMNIQEIKHIDALNLFYSMSIIKERDKEIQILDKYIVKDNYYS